MGLYCYVQISHKLNKKISENKLSIFLIWDISDATIGVYPLFKPSTADLGGSAVRAHITVRAGSFPHTPLAQPLVEEEIQPSSSEEEEEDRVTSAIQPPTPVRQSTQRQHTKSVMSDNTFTATVSVERAMHLSAKGTI